MNPNRQSQDNGWIETLCLFVKLLFWEPALAIAGGIIHFLKQKE